MRLLLNYQEAIVSLGLLPTLFTLVGLLWLPIQPVLWVGTIGSIAGLVYAVVGRRSLNFFLLQGTLSLTTCCLMRSIGGSALLPDGSVTFTLEFLLLTAAFLYLTLSGNYRQWQEQLHMMSHTSYRLEAKIIVILSSAHLLSLLLLYLGHTPPTPRIDLVFRHLIPIGIYVLCLAINVLGVRLALREEDIPSCRVRIAPVCKGKIYLSGKPALRPAVWDLPVERDIYGPLSAIDRKARRLMTRRGRRLPVAPRLLLRHWMPAPGSPRRQPVSVYICPLLHEDDFQTENGRYFTFEEITRQPSGFSPLLLKEIEHLRMAAEVWNEYEPIPKNFL